ncbi:MAG: hypothetical protein ACREC0_01450 [Methylocella sp.]
MIRSFRFARGRKLQLQLAAWAGRGRLHKARNIMERLLESMHRQARRGLRQAWELACAGAAAPLLCNLARRLDKD